VGEPRALASLGVGAAQRGGVGIRLEPLERVADGVWVATRSLPLVVGDVGTRMTVVRLASGELMLHSPVRIDPATRDAVDRVGRVRWIVGPSKVHHLFLGDWTAAHPDAELCGAPGLPEKRRDLRFAHVMDGAWQAPWGGELLHHPFAGAPFMNEVVFFHPASRTLLLTDLAFNVERGAPNRARVFHWLVGAVGRFGPHRIIRFGIRDRAAARRSLATILAWDFDRVIVTHGSVLESGGRAALERGFAFLGGGPG
jgi:hypothetical protein